MLLVTGHIYVDHLELAQFLRDLEVLASATRQRAGNISYDVAMADPQVGRLLVSERWSDQSALSPILMPSTPWRS